MERVMKLSVVKEKGYMFFVKEFPEDGLWLCRAKWGKPKKTDIKVIEPVSIPTQ